MATARDVPGRGVRHRPEELELLAVYLLAVYLLAGAEAALRAGCTGKGAWLARYSRDRSRTRRPRWWDWPSTARPYVAAAETARRPSTSWPRSCTGVRP